MTRVKDNTQITLYKRLYSVCTCGNPNYGFECTCRWTKENIGHIEYVCEHCGIYQASKARCNKCES